MNDELVLALSVFKDYLKENGIIFNLRLDAEVCIPLSVDEYDWISRKSIEATFCVAKRGDLFQFQGIETVTLDRSIYSFEKSLYRFYLVKDNKRTEEYWVASLDKAVKYMPDFKEYVGAAKAHYVQKVRDRFKKNMEKKQNENAKLQKLDPLFGSW